MRQRTDFTRKRAYISNIVGKGMTMRRPIDVMGLPIYGLMATELGHSRSHTATFPAFSAACRLLSGIRYKE